MSVVDRVYASSKFRRNELPIPMDLDPELAETVGRSPYLQSLVTLRAPPQAAHAVPPEARAHFIAGSKAAYEMRMVEAAHEYEAGLAIDPAETEARYDLAVVYASSGREDDAVAQARDVLARKPGHARAAALLCSLRGIACAP
jgi:hypothetical protein